MDKEEYKACSPLISVIIPVYNVEKYLSECLESVLQQTYSNLEVILINDGSTDHSGELCDKYARHDNRVRVIHKENGGQAVARNIAIKQAKGEYLSFIDSDDWIEPNMYERAIQEFASDTSLSVVRFGYQYRYADGSKGIETSSRSEIIWQGLEILNSYVQDNDGMNALMCASVYKTDIFQGRKSLGSSALEVARAQSLYYIEGIVHEDEMLSLSVGLKLSQSPYGEKIKILQEVMYNYRRDIVSTVSQLSTRHMRDMCYGFSEVRRYAETLPNTAWEVLDKKILFILRHYYGKWIKAGISLSEISHTTAQLRSTISTQNLSCNRGKWLYTLFCYSPKLYHLVERIYAPIVRRLGISQHYK